MIGWKQEGEKKFNFLLIYIYVISLFTAPKERRRQDRLRVTNVHWDPAENCCLAGSQKAHIGWGWGVRCGIDMSEARICSCAVNIWDLLMVKEHQLQISALRSPPVMKSLVIPVRKMLPRTITLPPPIYSITYLIQLQLTGPKLMAEQWQDFILL